MATLQTDRSKFFTMMVIIILGLFSMTLLAQEKEEVKSKLNQLKGKVEKITVKVDGKDVVFEGEEAQKIADKMKSEKRIKIFSSGDLKELEEDDSNVMVFRSEGKAGDFDIKTDGVKKKVNVEDKDGKMVVTITTMKDGKEETKTYEGDEAEKFLNEEKGMKHITVTMNDDEDMPKDHMIYFNRKIDKGMSKHGCNCCSGGCSMEMAPMHGNAPHKMMMKMKSDDNDNNESDVMIEKKIEKKEQKKTEKK
jgi:hypothetical protein